MQIILGNWSVSAVVYNDSAVRKEDSVIAHNKKYKSEVPLDLGKKSKNSYLPILMQIIQLQIYFDPIVCM